jgi:hypothetical protein
MDAQFAETLTLGKRILIPGCRYSVIQPFVDDKGTQHDLGETWTYLGVEGPKMYAGFVLYIFDATEKKIRLSYASNGQQKLIAHLEQYLSGPTVSTSELLSVISESARAALSRVESWLIPIPPEAESFIFQVRKAQGNASCADGRSGAGSPYEQVVADLAAVYREAINAFKTKASQKRVA